MSENGRDPVQRGEEESPAPGRRGLSLHTRILLGLVAGAVCGVAANVLTPRPAPTPAMVGVLAVAPEGSWPAGLPWAALVEASAEPAPHPLDWLLRYVTEPVGQVFLRMLLMTVVPLVFASLAVGVAKLGDLRRLGRIGARTFAFFLVSMTLAVVIGLTLVNVVRPGADLPAQTRDHLLRSFASAEPKAAAAPFGIQTFVHIVPRNPLLAMVNMEMLSVIFFALLVGLGITRLDSRRHELLLHLLEGVGDVMVFIINLAMRLAPYGVFALIFTVTARFGIDLLKQLGWYVVIVIGGIALQMFGTLSLLLAGLARLNPLTFFHRIRDVIVTAFSTSSSNATLPTSIQTAQTELGVPPQLAGFVLPLGATMNMNGTALFEGVTAVFLAQVFGIELTLGQQVIVVVLSVLTAVGAAGVPGGSIPLLAMVITAVGVPAEAIAIIIGVDRLLDMCRTTLNVTGDLAAAAYVARVEGYELLPERGRDGGWKTETAPAKEADTSANVE